MTTKKIRGDHARFRKLINGKINERLKKFIKTGHILKMRPNGKGKMSVPIPQIEQPQFRFGKMKEGIGRGKAKPGDVIDREWEPGFGPDAGEEGTGGMFVDVDTEDVLNEMERTLRLPRMKPKNSNTFEATKTTYNDVSKTGPRSLVHKRRTIKKAMKRGIAEGTWGKKVLLPGYSAPVPILNIRNDDFLYRQWNQVKIPRANCLIVFGRDGSGSMDDFKCNIVSDLAFWIDMWISREYEKSETLYLWHDTEAKEVSRDDFYHLRHGGGTICSSALTLLEKLIKLKYSPEKWNIYYIYFGDGDNFRKDNPQVLEMLLKLEPCLNMAAICQVLASDWEDSLKKHIDENVEKFQSTSFIRTTSVGGDKGFKDDDDLASSWFGSERDERLDEEMKQALIDILGADQPESEDFMEMAI
jgi:uncharacterized sporulation protein YeaH/YhbH (DUF444 family)